MGRPRSEDELVALARGGDRDAFAELVRAHQPTAFRTALMITRNAAEAEDAAQEAFVKAWRALGRFRAGRPFRPWLLAIVANQARDRWRSGTRRDRLALRAAGEARSDGGAAPSPEAALLAGEQRERLLAALEDLRDDDRLILGCRYLLELSEEETMGVLRLRRGTVKSQTSRALERLRAQLEGDTP